MRLFVYPVMKFIIKIFTSAVLTKVTPTTSLLIFDCSFLNEFPVDCPEVCREA
jgi:hypothetical protein